MAEKKPYISASQLDMFCKCPEQYRRRYIEKEIIPPGMALLKGKGFHRAIDLNMRQKIESHVDLPASQIVEASVEAFKTQLAGGYVLDDDETRQGAELAIGLATDSLADHADCHARFQAPDYQPILVEQTIRIDLPNCDRDLLGVIDIADTKDRVTDFKTAKARKNQSDVDTSVQLTVYASAYHAINGRPPSEVRLDSSIQTKTKTTRQLLTSNRAPADFDALAARIHSVLIAIDAGLFPPAFPGAWWCSPKWCGYWRTCRYVNSERKALVSLKDGK